MEVLLRLIIGKERKNQERQDMLWNMIGSFLYAFASMLLTIAVVSIAGEDAGGVFTFAFTTFGQHMFMVAYFGIRPFQITDTAGKYSFGDYFGLRLMTCAFAVAFGAVYILLHDYSKEKAAVIFFMVLYKVIDALADTYEAEFQRGGRLYLTGKSNAFRTILSVAVFLTVLSGTGGRLVTAGAAAVSAQAAGFFLFDVLVLRALPDVERSSKKGRKWMLFKDNTLLFFSVILDFYIFSASKYAIEGCMADRDMAVYGAIFMPTSVINLVAGFVIRPYLTKLSFVWEMGKPERFTRLILRLAAVIGALTVLAVGGAWFLGIPVLGLLYSNLRYALHSCRLALTLIIAGGAFNALMNLFYYSLIIMKKQRLVFDGYGLVGILAVLISGPFVQAWGILGGALAYGILMAALAAVFGLAVFFFIAEKRRYPDGLANEQRREIVS